MGVAAPAFLSVVTTGLSTAAINAQAGASLKIESEQGENSLDVALRKGHSETADVLRAEQIARAMFSSPGTT